MTILEEVIMYTFQQCVYYITKVICPCGNSAIVFKRKTIIIVVLKWNWTIIVLQYYSQRFNYLKVDS